MELNFDCDMMNNERRNEQLQITGEKRRASPASPASSPCNNWNFNTTVAVSTRRDSFISAVIHLFSFRPEATIRNSAAAAAAIVNQIPHTSHTVELTQFNPIHFRQNPRGIHSSDPANKIPLPPPVSGLPPLPSLLPPPPSGWTCHELITSF